MVGPTLAISEQTHAEKYRLPGETFYDCGTRVADALKDDVEHFEQFREILHDMRFLPGGRVQNAMGSPRKTTAYNCFVSGLIEDSMDSIGQRSLEAAETMRRGGGIGYDFSRLRPAGTLIKTLGSRASGPVSFMQVFDAWCQTIASAGHRRGAQMGVIRVDHPDIELFIRAKRNDDMLKGFNISVGITDEFMHCLLEGMPFELKWDGQVVDEVDPQRLWDEIMRSTWDWAEPGVLFLDQINSMNNLWYCETIEATNPCGEQPLPPYGACLLGSFNLVKYVQPTGFDYDAFTSDIAPVVRAMDNVVDRTIYPLPEQEAEAKAKRRMGLGVTGLANAAEMLGMPYASEAMLDFTAKVVKHLTVECYSASADLAVEKGRFPLYDSEKYAQSRFVRLLPIELQRKIKQQGMRNSHLTSIAPTGTISLCADYVSAGIEPPFSLTTERTIQSFDGPRVVTVEDYAAARGFKGVTADELTAEEHVLVLAKAQQWIDSACSKTCNVGPDVSFDDFKDLYINAWRAGCKGLTTFRANGKRFGILTAVIEEPEATACFIDPDTGQKECS